MILKVTCPSCQKAYRLSPPYPPPGKRYRCTCGAVITVSYPPELRRMLEDGELPEGVSRDIIPSSLQAPSRGGLTETEEVDRLLWTQTGDPRADLVRTQEGASGPTPPRAPDVDLASTHPAFEIPRAPARPAEPDPTLARTQPRPDLAQTRSLDGRERLDATALSGDLSATRTAVPDEGLLRTQATQVALDPPAAEDLALDEVSRSASPHRLSSPIVAERAPLPSRAPAAEPTPPREPLPVERAALGPRGPAAEEPDREPFPAAPLPPEPAAGDAPAAPTPRPRMSLARRLAIGAVGLAVLGALTVGAVVWYYSQNLPSVESLAEYRPPVVSRVYASDGRLIGELFEEYRDVTPLKDIPPHVTNAFLAAEDSSFYEHGGIDYLGVVRAVFVNVLQGRKAQGGSTITQQVARSFLLSREKKFERKVREVLLAYRVEANFPKDHILYLYLNQIFLGEGAYGVAAGARIFFDKDIKDVTIAEAALLAGLPPAPSTYNPVRNWEAAKQRQKYVLSRMVSNDMITQAEADAAWEEQVRLVGRVDRNKGPWASFTEHVRRALVEEYGHDKVYREGLSVETTLDYDLQAVAAQAVAEGAIQTDERVGYRGPLEHIEASAIPAFLDAQYEALRLEAWQAMPGGEAHNGPAPRSPPELVPGDRIKGVLTEVTKTWARVGIDKERAGYIILDDHTWLYSVNPKRSWKYRAQDDLTAQLNVGDVILFELRPPRSENGMKKVPDALKERGDFGTMLNLHLFQEPKIEASLLSYRVTDGAVLAMVGGYDFKSSEFNRVTQARRQSGSTFKPFVYAAALDHPEKHYTPSTILLDAPLTMHKETSDEESIDLWKPSNYAGDYMGEVTFRKALILSRNTPTVRILDDIGVPYFYDYVMRLGFDSPLNKDLSMGLGSSSVTLLEMCRAYSTFATLGERVEPRFVNRVLDRDGNVLADRTAEVTRVETMNPATAYVMTGLLKDVVNMGTGTGARDAGRPVAGKTGTTNDFKDAWFIGYTPEIITGAWTGYDQPESMGYGQTGGDAVVPFWTDFMKVALKKYPDTDYRTPDKVVFVNVDSESGLLATDATERRMRIAFIKGTEPTEYARGAGEVGTDDFFMMDTQ